MIKIDYSNIRSKYSVWYNFILLKGNTNIYVFDVKIRNKIAGE